MISRLYLASLHSSWLRPEGGGGGKSRFSSFYIFDQSCWRRTRRKKTGPKSDLAFLRYRAPNIENFNLNCKKLKRPKLRRLATPRSWNLAQVFLGLLRKKTYVLEFWFLPLFLKYEVNKLKKYQKSQFAILLTWYFKNKGKNQNSKT